MARKPDKPSQQMLDVIKLMKKGWTLHRSMTIDGSLWLSAPGARGFHKMRATTFTALHRRQFIESNGYSFPTETYKLTKAGANAV